uniref:NADH-ubiquinone oxidoreductase chain 4 n=1 Tax=Melamphaus faber TaxID=702479 RepID=A0A4Y1JVU8_9HEMI|nr:NADH dehydrogenase subunit 4 [Melamphaus faber]APO08879.1 NADH dehydrogenase subunit 4 [Melamphaus faber]
MMKIFFTLLFLIPLFNFWWVVPAIYFFVSFNLFFSPVSVFISSLSYSFGADLLSLCLMVLTVWIGALMMMASCYVKFYMFRMFEFVLMLNFMVISLFLTFSTINFLLFYIFFESSMVPILFLIFGWGYQPERLIAAFYLLFYTLFASLPMLLCMFFLFYVSLTLCFYLIDKIYNFYLYLGMIMVFLVKLPMFFLHFWLPKAHVEAPISGSMILAGVLLKLGGYGLFRVLNFIWPFSLSYNWIWIIWSLLGGLVLSIMCICQVDLKSLIAYSSVVHMSMVVCGTMTLNFFGLFGSLLLMLGHGLCSSGLFVLANYLYERSGSRSLFINKGFINTIPLISLFWFIFIINNIASPISLNLFGESMLLNSLVCWNWRSMGFLGLMALFSCAYSIYVYAITQHGLLYAGLLGKIPGIIIEYTVLFFHLFPLNFLFLKAYDFILWL